MATYNELFGLHNNSDLMNKVTVACIVAAEEIINETSPPSNQAARETWAALVFRNPRGVAEPMYWALLAANKDNTVIQIEGASDTAIQTAVDDHVDLFADNL